MRWKILFLALLLVPVCAFAYSFWGSYLTDDFDVYLQAMGYNPLHPPRNEFRLGSLYDVDQNGNLDLVCPTTEAQADNYTGPSQKIDRAKEGSFSVIGDIADRLRETLGDEYSKHVKLSLRDIRLQQIAASKDGEIQDALMKDRACVRAVTNRLRLGHYICQVQSSFSAVAVYEIDDELSSSATAKGKQALTEAVQAETKMQARESGNNVLTGDLVFGVKLEPVCISPANAIFIRTWPASTFARGIDFVKYDMIEPLVVSDLFGRDAGDKVALD